MTENSTEGGRHIAFDLSPEIDAIMTTLCEETGVDKRVAIARAVRLCALIEVPADFLQRD